MATQLLDHGDALRREVAPSLALKRKSALGQFMTPSPVARFMASLFPPTNLQNCHLLDAGAGVGALSCAFLDRLASAEELNFQNVEVEAYEIENASRAHLETTLASYAERLPVTYTVSSGDFIWEAASEVLKTYEEMAPATVKDIVSKTHEAFLGYKNDRNYCLSAERRHTRARAGDRRAREPADHKTLRPHD